MTNRRMTIKTTKTKLLLLHALRHVALAALAVLACLLPAQAGAQQHESAQQLLHQCEVARDKSHHQQLSQLAGRLLAVARQQHDARLVAYALMYKGSALLFTGNDDKAVATLQQALKAAGDAGNDSVKAAVMNNLGIYYASMAGNPFYAQQSFLKGKRLAMAAGDSSLQLRIAGNLLVLTKTPGYNESIAQARAIWSYGKAHRIAELAYMGAFYMAQCQHHASRYREALKWVQECLDIYGHYHYNDIAYVHVLHSQILLDMGKTAQAAAMAQTAVEVATRLHQLRIVPDALLQLAHVERKRGNLEASTGLARKALDAARRARTNTMLVDAQELLASNYIDLRQPDSAYAHLMSAFKAMQSVQSFDFKQLEHEQSIMQNIEAMEHQAQLHALESASQRRVAWALAAVVAVLVALLATTIVAARRRSKLYRGIVAQNVKALARQQELQERLASLAASSASDSASSAKTVKIDEKRGQEIYDRLCQLMEQDRVFTNPQLGREALAEMLGTNRTYLSAIVKEKSGMNVLQYINSYRIGEAVKILSDKAMVSLPLKRIYSEVGFASPTTFYKLFQQQVGITPHTYRKQFLEMDHDSSHDHNSA